jgi:hypothetical protein
MHIFCPIFSWFEINATEMLLNFQNLDKLLNNVTLLQHYEYNILPFAQNAPL